MSILIMCPGSRLLRRCWTTSGAWDSRWELTRRSSSHVLFDSFDVALASDLDAETLGKCHLRAVEPSAVVRDWVDAFEGRPHVAVVPNANTTFFIEEPT